MNILQKLLLVEDIKQIKGTVCISGPSTLERKHIHLIWAFRNYEMAEAYYDQLRSKMINDDIMKYVFALHECTVEMGGLMKPGIVALFDHSLMFQNMKFIGVGKSKESILDDAEDYIKEQGLDDHDIDWFTYIELDDMLYDW